MTPEFDNSYLTLPERFYTRQAPVAVTAPEIVRVNRPLAEQLQIDPAFLASEAGAEIAVGNALLEGSEPIATVYAGHQFGGFAPRLGDGRAILLGEVLDRDGERFDLQLKGSGRTPYSRGGDGRSPLGPVLREYIVSEAMFALGVPTSRALAAATTGEVAHRQQGPEPGAVLMRVARSHIRVGTFEYFASVGDTEGVEELVAHVLERHYPEAEDTERPALELLKRVAERQAALVAQWMLVGFVHGVMNTDNMLVSGETIDYGPCAFIDTYEPGAVFSSIDRGGRYAFRNQAPIAQWNLMRLAAALLPVFGVEQNRAVEEIQAVLDAFPEQYAEVFSEGMATKLGWSRFGDGDAVLVDDLLKRMEEAKADYTLTFRKLTDIATEAGEDEALGEVFELPEALWPWVEKWRARCANDPLSAEGAAAMRAANPAVIPRNHLVADAIDAANRDHDYAPFHALVEVLATPGEYEPSRAKFAAPPAPERPRCVTFCGT